MKTKHIFLLLFFSLLLSNCSKDDDSKIATMQAKVDGTLIVCDSIVYFKQGLSGTLYGLEGYKKGNIGFKLLFPISQGVGAYPFLTFSSDYVNMGSLFYGYFNNYNSTNGSVIITEASVSRFKGTFSFTGVNYPQGESKIISEGVFEIDN
jgi:hypothetical protein